MMSCKEASKLYCETMDRPVPWYRRLYLRMHLWICSCPLCKSFGSQMEFMRHVTCQSGEAIENDDGDDGEAVKLDDEAKTRMKALLEKKS